MDASTVNSTSNPKYGPATALPLLQVMVGLVMCVYAGYTAAENIGHGLSVIEVLVLVGGLFATTHGFLFNERAYVVWGLTAAFMTPIWWMTEAPFPVWVRMAAVFLLAGLWCISLGLTCWTYYGRRPS